MTLGISVAFLCEVHALRWPGHITLASLTPPWYDIFIPYSARGEAVATAEKRTISLPPEQAGYIDALVTRGTYASASEVVRAGLRALQEREAAVERWLREEVVPVYDSVQADPSRALRADRVRRAVRAHHGERSKLGR